MAQVGWSIRGRVLVRHVMRELRETYERDSPLAGIRVRIEARERIAGAWASWKKWEEFFIQDDDGGFRVSKIKSHHRRQFRVRVQFKSDRLVVFGANRSALRQASRGLRMLAAGGPLNELLLDQVLQHFTRIPYESDWYTIHTDRGADMRRGRAAGVHDFGDLLFRPNGPGDLGDWTARRQADLWFLYSRAMELFAGFGAEFAFTKRVAVKFPHNNPLVPNAAEASYANPENHLIYIVDNPQVHDYRIDYILHELMHIWAYQHCRREKGIAWQLIIHGDTHGMQDRSWVAFHEGFAEYAYQQVYRLLFGRNPKLGPASTTDAKPLPTNRSYLTNIYGINTLADVDHHEDGWMSALNLLTTPRLSRYSFGGTQKHVAPARFRISRNMVCRDIALSFTDILRLFLTDDSAGNRRQLRRSEMTLEGILDRAVAVIPRFNNTARRSVLRLLDPQETVQPRDLLCRERRRR